MDRPDSKLKTAIKSNVKRITAVVASAATLHLQACATTAGIYTINGQPIPTADQSAQNIAAGVGLILVSFLMLGGLLALVAWADSEDDRPDTVIRSYGPGGTRTTESYYR